LLSYEGKKIVDLSTPIDDSSYEVHSTTINRIDWRSGLKKLNKVLLGYGKSPVGTIQYFFGKRIITSRDLPDGEFLSLEIVHASVHIGTHIDFTYHYGSTSGGKPSEPIDALPLEWCIGHGVRLDLRHKRDAAHITNDDIRQVLNKIRYKLQPADIVLICTGASANLGVKDYFANYPGIDVSSIDYLLDNGVKIFGVDTMGIDQPYQRMIGNFRRSGNSSYLWPAHLHGRKRPFAHVERLVNLENLPDYGFTVLCMPIRIRKTGAAWCRSIAII
jgi:kynurenine formamidase